MALLLACAACGTVSAVTNTLTGGPGPQLGQTGFVRGFLGGVVADEPEAAVVGRQALSAGGNAADAAVAAAFALTVTLPSRAGLGGSGACIAYRPGTDSPSKGSPEAILFTPQAPPLLPPPTADRPAALPTMPRGLFLLHARYGRLPFEQLVAPAERLARFGMPASRALVDDLRLVSRPLFADPAARAVFSANGAALAVGQQLLQPSLGSTLAQIRVEGVGDFYEGIMARRIAQQTPLAGGPLTLAALHAALPHLAQPIALGWQDNTLSFLPPPADGGLAAAAAFQALERDPANVVQAGERAQEVAAEWRASGGAPTSVLTSSAPAATLPPLPASTTLLTLDRNGGAVACALTMGNLFGTGRIVPGMGFLLAPSPREAPPPLLAAGIAWSPKLQAFRAEAAGSGQNAAAQAAALALFNTLRSGQPMPSPVPDPGRANLIECNQYLPGAPASCRQATDPRGAGLATGGG